MATSVVTTKGQVTIPLGIREAMGLRKGDVLEFRHSPETGRVDIRKKTGSIRAVIGLLKYEGSPVSVEAMNGTIQKNWLGELDRR